MKFRCLFLWAILFTLTSTPISAKIIHVPGDSSTIQGGINGAVNGDTVLVAPDTYYEHINFNGKAILVTSEAGAESTIISKLNDGQPMVSFVSGEDRNSVLDGFTIQNAKNSTGIICSYNTSPIIRNNILKENSAYLGGGIFCQSNSSPIIENNLIIGNTAQSQGGAIFLDHCSAAVVVNNTMVNNAATQGGGVQNIYSDSTILLNNIVVGSSSGYGISSSYSTNTVVEYNDVWNNLPADYADCPPSVGDTTWGENFNGTPCDSFHNIICDPMFADTISYALLCSSACIDAGDSTFEVPDGGGRRIDIGVYEHPYVIGDVNEHGDITISDVVFLVKCVLKSGLCPCPLGRGDANCNSQSTIDDIVYLVNYLFKSGPPPCEPE